MVKVVKAPVGYGAVAAAVEGAVAGVVAAMGCVLGPGTTTTEVEPTLLLTVVKPTSGTDICVLMVTVLLEDSPALPVQGTTVVATTSMVV